MKCYAVNDWDLKSISIRIKVCGSKIVKDIFNQSHKDFLS